jgi:hypothetical protein
MYKARALPAHVLLIPPPKKLCKRRYIDILYISSNHPHHMIEPITKIMFFILLNRTVLSLHLYSVRFSRDILPKVGKKERNILPPPPPVFQHLPPLLCCEQTPTTNTDKPPPDDQCVVVVKNNLAFCRSKLNLYLCSNDFFANKELMTISPGGLKGFYLLGILSYIKETYDTDNLIYSGASAGSWNGLFMCFKGDAKKMIYDLFEDVGMDKKSIIELQYLMKYKLLAKYKTEDFDLKKLFVGVSSVKGLSLYSHIFTEFPTLEDAINCCMASSHIPLVTGGLTNKYNNMYSLDGGLSDHPYLNLKRKIHISPHMWKDLKRNVPFSPIPKGEQEPQPLLFKLLKSILLFPDFFSAKHNNPLKLFDDGYLDAKLNRHHLDAIFMKKRENVVEVDTAEHTVSSALEPEPMTEEGEEPFVF